MRDAHSTSQPADTRKQCSTKQRQQQYLATLLPEDGRYSSTETCRIKKSTSFRI
jgi:hypothetical protein